MNSPNNYIDSFLSADEIIQNMSQTPTEIRISIHADVRPSNEHIRRYNLPTSSEISILMPEDVAENENREVICSYRDGVNHVKKINDTHRSYDPLAYPLFFPYGTDGYHLGLKNTEGKHLSPLQFLV